MDNYPEIEDLDAQELKLLMMMLVENRAGVDFKTDKLTEYGQQLFRSVQRKIGIMVVGVDAIGQAPAMSYEACPCCAQPIIRPELRFAN